MLLSVWNNLWTYSIIAGLLCVRGLSVNVSSCGTSILSMWWSLFLSFATFLPGGCTALILVITFVFLCSRAASLPIMSAGILLQSAPKTVHYSFLKHGRNNFSRHLQQTVAVVINGIYCEISIWKRFGWCFIFMSYVWQIVYGMYR